MRGPPGAATVAVNTALTLVIAAFCGFAMSLTGIPAGWLMGGALGVSVAGLMGVAVTMPRWLRDATFVMTGVSMGANVARDSLALMLHWPVTLAALVVELVLIITITGYVLRKLFRIDRGTAYLSSFPGHLSFVMSIAAAGVGDPRQITIIQVIRILLLTTVVPIGALFLPVNHAIAPAGGPSVGWLDLAAVTLVCAGVGFVFARLHVPAAYALGAMAASMVAKFSGLFEGTMPGPLLIVIYVLVGALIGSRFAGITLGEFARASVGGIIGTLITVAIASATAFGAAAFVDMPYGQIWLGLAPGGLESMGTLGIALGFDTAFIAAHHVARLLLLTIAIPVVALLVRETDNKE